MKNNIFSDRETFQPRIEFIPVSAHACELYEFPACFLNFVKEPVRVIRVVSSNIKPDFLNVVFSLGALEDSQYQSIALVC